LIYFKVVFCYTYRVLGINKSGLFSMDIKVDFHSATPLYQQIADQLRQLIATEQVKPGDRLPSIRQLSRLLNINPNTVCRAYLELEQDNILVSRRGGGTSVKSRDVSQEVRSGRQKKLMENMNEDIVRSLSQGYRPEELEAAFYLSLERWREERQQEAKEPAEIETEGQEDSVIRIVGSHDLALNILLDLLRQRVDGLKTEVTHAGSLGGLIALQEERADLAGTHLLDEETGEYNYPYVKRILPGRELAIVNLSFRIQGLMYASGNPRKIKGLEDLRRQDIVFVNRQKGSGTRVLLDLQLKRQGISPSEITGYEVEFNTHLAVASHISHGNADVGLGIEAAALSCGLAFQPLFRERYDLVIPIANYRSPRLAPMQEIIASDDFKKIVDGVGGYDTSQTGTTTFLS
jgi:molybdate-binding protein/DNA-binding transcriptional regulator YhcF (GntR family)